MAGSKSNKRKYVSYLLRFSIAGVALYLAFRGESLKQVTEVLLGLNLWIFAAALGIYIVSQLIFVARWYLLLSTQSIQIGFWAAVRLHFLGLFYNNCLPSSVGGDLLRAWYVTKHTDKKLEAALSVFVDRVIGLAGMFIMAAFCYWSIPIEGRNTRPLAGNFEFRISNFEFFDGWILVGIGAALAIIIAGFIGSVKGRTLVRRCLRFIRQQSAVVLGRVRDAVRIYCNKKWALFGALLLTFCCQGVFIIGMVLIGSGIGVTAHIKYYFIFFPISWLLGTLPISVGGAGIMEWWLKVMFIRVCAVSSQHALALALCQRLLWLLGSLPGVAIHLLGGHLPKGFFIDYDRPVN